MKKFALGLVAVSSALALAACSPALEVDSDVKEDTNASAAPIASPSAGETSATTAATTSAAAEDSAVTLSNGWVRAYDPATAMNEGMTGAFGVFENNTDADIVITSFSANVGTIFELHEVVDGRMREMAGDMIIPAGGEYVLQPGSNHLMLMGLDEAIAAGDTVELTIVLSDGTTLVEELPVRTSPAGDEDYAG